MYAGSSSDWSRPLGFQFRESEIMRFNLCGVGELAASYLAPIIGESIETDLAELLLGSKIATLVSDLDHGFSV